MPKIERIRSGIGRKLEAGRRGRHVVMASAVLALVASPWAVAASTGGSIVGGKRNPGSSTSAEYSKETQIIGDIAQGKGGVASGTGGYTTRQSNKSSSGGGAIYGCRATAGKNSCLVADNLANGSAFQFIAQANADHVGEILFNGKSPSPQAPFVTNGTGLVKNLNADTVDGKQASDLVGTDALLFAVVSSSGALGSTRGASGASQTSGSPPTYSVAFSRDVSQCAYTASPTDTGAGTVAVTNGSDANSVTVTESGSASGFHLQVTC